MLAFTPISPGSPLTNPPISEFPLHAVCQKPILSLIDKYAITELITSVEDLDEKDRDGNTSLHYAAFHLNTYAIEFLLRLGANASSKNIKDQTPLHMALCNTSNPEGVAEVVNILLKYNAFPLICDQKGQLPIDLAIAQNNHKAIQALQEVRYPEHSSDFSLDSVDDSSESSNPRTQFFMDELSDDSFFPIENL